MAINAGDPSSAVWGGNDGADRWVRVREEVMFERRNWSGETNAWSPEPLETKDFEISVLRWMLT